MKTVLVAGGAGFIGSHLCQKLSEQGHRVICFDNLSTGSFDNISSINCEFYEIDVSRTFYLDQKVDFIFHLASPASPIDYLERPLETLKAGSFATHNLLELAEDNSARFLLASTSEVYGDPLEHPQKEDYYGNVNPVGPRSVYDEAKRYAEAVTTAYHTEYKLDSRIARIFNTYGPRMNLNDGRVIPTFIRQFIDSEKFTVFGDGNQTRSFCYVDDLVEGLMRLMFADNVENINTPHNIGNPYEFTINELAYEINDLMKNMPGADYKKFDIEYKDLPKDDPKKRKPDITKARDNLGWHPTIQLNDGLRKTIAHYL